MEFISSDAQIEVDDKISSASLPLPPAQFTRRGGRMLSELSPRGSAKARTRIWSEQVLGVLGTKPMEVVDFGRYFCGLAYSL